ncbi:MAG: hypothetical protein ACREP9_01740 [Candidatus Dormibacteraceae bacterium]
MLANTEIHWEALESNLKAALGLASRFGEAYRRADSTERRWFNRATVESIGVDVDGEIKKAVLAEPFRTLVDDGLVGRLIEEMKNRRPPGDGGSTIVKLVEVIAMFSNPSLTLAQLLKVMP